MFAKLRGTSEVAEQKDEWDPVLVPLIKLLTGQKGFVYTVQYAPLPGEDPNKKPKRWPDRVKRVEPKDSMSYDETFFYVIQYEGNTTLQHMMLGVVILMVLAGCMFPAWPLWAKFGMWY